jgi:hypothetical protein
MRVIDFLKTERIRHPHRVENYTLQLSFTTPEIIDKEKKKEF